jgi:signal peptide peptidase SppA
MNNSLSLRTNFSNNFLNERKPNLVYTKIYSSNAIVFPPLKKLFLGSVLLYTGIQSFRQWRKYNKSMTINNNSTVFWNVNKTIIDDNGLQLTHLLNGRNNDVMTFLDIIQTIEEIKNDDRITGFVADLSSINKLTVNSDLGFAQIQEIKHALDELKEIKNKKLKNNFKMLAFTDTFDSQADYFLASSFDKICMEPTGMVPLIGFGTVQPFFKSILEKYGIKTQSHVRNEYKNAVSFLTSTEYNNSQKKNLTHVFSNLTHQLAEGIAKGRGKSLDNLKILKNSNLLVSLLSSSKTIDDNTEKMIELINQGPYSASEAIDLGLIDKLDYRRRIITDLKKKGDDQTISFAKYHIARSNEIQHEKRQVLKIAGKQLVPNHVNVSLVHIKNDITKDHIDEVITSLMKAGYDKNTEAIVIRIDSPGGDYGASDTIWEAVDFIKKESKKPIVASFGNVAASGGYYIALACDKILASPGTITGSIGVASARPVISKQQLKKWGITLDEIQITEGTKYYSIFNELSGPHLEKFIKHVNEAYELFKKRVMDGRNMDTRQVDEIAGGQIWTGFDATTNGLVDKIGGLSRSIQEAAHLALSRRKSESFNKEDIKLMKKYAFLKNSEEPSIKVVDYQKPSSFFDLLNNTSLEQEIFSIDEIKNNNNNSKSGSKSSSSSSQSASSTSTIIPSFINPHSPLTAHPDITRSTEFYSKETNNLIQHILNYYIHSVNKTL